MVDSERILLLHPGEMGASIGAALVSAGHSVVWVQEGRSADTYERADQAGLVAKPDLMTALERVDGIISVCPPESALDVVSSVYEAGFRGLYVDANAVSPETARHIQSRAEAGFVDGGIVGPPAWKPGSTRLYLSGPEADRVVRWFSGTPVDARMIEGSASALKMCYAAFTKGSSALLLAICALADREGVAGDLVSEWEISQPGLPGSSRMMARSNSAKAWRFEAEMREIARTFSDADLPSGFHEAAAEVYHTLRDFKGKQASLDEVIATLLGGGGGESEGA